MGKQDTFVKWTQGLGSAGLVFSVFWMVYLVRPVEVEVPSVQARIEVAVPSSTAGAGSRMPNRTEREMAKLCQANLSEPRQKRALRMEKGWDGSVGDAVRNAGLSLEWECIVKAWSPGSGVTCATRREGGRTFQLLPTHHLGQQTSPWPLETALKLANLRTGLAEREGIVLNMAERCRLEWVIDSDRFVEPGHSN